MNHVYWAVVAGIFPTTETNERIIIWDEKTINPHQMFVYYTIYLKIKNEETC